MFEPDNNACKNNQIHMKYARFLKSVVVLIFNIKRTFYYKILCFDFDKND